MKIRTIAFVYLETLVLHGQDDMLRSIDLSGASGQRIWGSNHQMLLRIRDAGLVSQPYHGIWRITERGKIAWAIQAGINARRRGQKLARAA